MTRRVKASKSVMIGDTVDVYLTPGGPRVLEVAGLADKRSPAKVAVTLYVDHTPPPPPTGPMAGDPTFDRGSRRRSKGCAADQERPSPVQPRQRLVSQAMSSDDVTSPAASVRASLAVMR